MQNIKLEQLNFSNENNLDIKLSKDKKYNLWIKDDINYTIYCGAWIL